MFTNFTNEGSRYNDFAEGFGAVRAVYGDNNARTLAGAANANVVTDTIIGGIPGLSHQAVMFKPLSGIFNQTKYLPLRFMPLTIELSLVDNFEEPLFLIWAMQLLDSQILPHLLYGRSRMYRRSVIS